jgi:hypothetical protein
LADHEAQGPDQEQTQKIPQPCQDTAEVVADGGEDGVGGIAGAAFEIAAAEVTFRLEMADHRLDGRAASQFALDDAEHAALLSGDEDAARVLRVVTAVSLVDIGALDFAAGELLGVFDLEGVPVVWVAGQRPGMQHELTARRTSVGGDDRDLDAELVGRAGLALADTLGLRGVEGIELPAALTLLGADLGGVRQRQGECRLEVPLVGNLAADVTDQPAQTRAQDAQFPTVAVAATLLVRIVLCAGVIGTTQHRRAGPAQAQPSIARTRQRRWERQPRTGAAASTRRGAR